MIFLSFAMRNNLTIVKIYKIYYIIQQPQAHLRLILVEVYSFASYVMRDFLFVLKVVLVCATAFFCIPATAQSPTELALKNIQRQKWQRAYSLLQKSLSKDSLNVTAKYVLAQYFFSEENPAHDLDAAYTFVTEAFAGFQSSSRRQRERLRRFSLDSVRIMLLRQKIDSVAFTKAKELHTEKGYTAYITRF